MTSRIAALALLVVLAPAPAAEKGQLDYSPALFTVLAAMNVAGYDADLASCANHPLRAQLRQYLEGKHLKSIEELKRFFELHHQKDPSLELSQYVSFSLLVTDPPEFAFTLPENQLPPDVAALGALGPILARFYEEAQIGAILRKVQPAIDQELSRYQMPVISALTEVNAYLRNPTSGYLGHRFQIFVDLLGAPNQIQTRSYRDDYFVVLTSTADIPVDDIRHAYLHYLLDPMVLKYSAALEKKKPLIDFAGGSPILDEPYKNDFILLATESLIKAVESRLVKGGSAKKQAVADQAAREGFILTPAFADLLAGYEQQERALRLYFPDMAALIDLKKETKRLDKVDFLSQRPVRVLKPCAGAEPSAIAKAVEEAESLYEAKSFDAARDAFLKIPQMTVEKSYHAKAYYGLARIALRQGQGELADGLFKKTLELEPDAEVRAWSLLYLARLADSQENREEAVSRYKQALAVAGVPDKVKQAAEKGLSVPFGKVK